MSNRSLRQPSNFAKLTHRKGGGGRLYRFDMRNPNTPCIDVPNAICSLKPSRATVFFWLCAQYSSKHSLKFNFHDGVTVEPLTEKLLPTRSNLSTISEAATSPFHFSSLRKTSADENLV
jgi:hypothetical protein